MCCDIKIDTLFSVINVTQMLGYIRDDLVINVALPLNAQ